MNVGSPAKPETTSPTEPRQKFSAGQVALWLLRGRTLIVLVLLIVVFSLISVDYLTQSNLISMTKHVSVNAILAIGVTFVILTGGIDLSVGSIAGLASMFAGILLYQGLPMAGGVLWFSVPLVILLSLGVGAGVGAVNGLIVTRFGVAPFIATLGMLYVARGFAQIMSNGGTFPDLAGSAARGNQGFRVLGVDSWLGLPVSVWIMVVVAALAIVVTTRTPFGRRVFAVGGNERAAVLSGISHRPHPRLRLRHLRRSRCACRHAPDIRAAGRVPRHCHHLRTQCHRRGRPRWHLAERRTRDHHRHDHGRLRHRLPE